MKLNRIENQWINENLDELKYMIEIYDFAMKRRDIMSHDQLIKIHDVICDMLFSMLWIIMGNPIPKKLYSANDYSVLYEVISGSDELEITNE